jgi:hypothetical protein
MFVCNGPAEGMRMLQEKGHSSRLTNKGAVLQHTVDRRVDIDSVRTVQEEKC